MANKRPNYPKDRKRRGTWKVEESIYIYQHNPAKFAIKVKAANGNWVHVGIARNLDEARIMRDVAITREHRKTAEFLEHHLQLGGCNGSPKG